MMGAIKLGENNKMSLRLNPEPEDYKEFYGSNTEQMQKLLTEGRTPLSVSGLMKARLEFGENLQDWMNNHFDTGDAVVYHPNGTLKVLLDSNHLRELTPDSKLHGGALVLPNGTYESLDGEEFTREDLEKYVGKELTEEQVRENPIWRTLSRDQSLLSDYAELIFRKSKERLNYENNMGVYLDSISDNIKLRAWLVDRLGYGSRVGGGDSLDVSNGRFLGLAPEAQDASITRQDTVTLSLEKVLALGEQYVPSIAKSQFEKSVRDLFTQ
jgi:hypothetical protein